MKPELVPRTSPAASVSPTPGGGFLLKIPAGPAGRYRLAQLDDYAHLPRRRFPRRAPQAMTLRARASAGSLPGTWGFGFWNDPFVFSFGLGGVPIRLPTLPNAAWFFYASRHNHLSFRGDKPARGFLAQTFRSPRFHPLLIPAALGLPVVPAASRRLLARVIGEEAAAVSVDVTAWHDYRLEWQPDRVTFAVDEHIRVEAPLAPLPPLGVVIWIDNQYAAFTPEGRIRWGMLENPDEAWLEIGELLIE